MRRKKVYSRDAFSNRREIYNTKTPKYQIKKTNRTVSFFHSKT